MYFFTHAVMKSITHARVINLLTRNVSDSQLYLFRDLMGKRGSSYVKVTLYRRIPSRCSNELRGAAFCDKT